MNRIFWQTLPPLASALICAAACGSDDSSQASTPKEAAPTDGAGTGGNSGINDSDQGNESGGSPGGSSDPGVGSAGTPSNDPNASGGNEGTAAGGMGGTDGLLGGLLGGDCPEDKSTPSCGNNQCPAVEENLIRACVQTCCTPEGTCGTFNASSGGDCLDVSGGTEHSCPDATVLGSEVPGCCVEGGNVCGIVDLTGTLASFVGGDGQGCIARERVPAVAAQLEPMACGRAVRDTEQSGAPDAGAN